MLNACVCFLAGFESTLHEVECSDGQSVSILRAFNGEQFAYVTELWRKYFPEVNGAHRAAGYTASLSE